MCFMTSTFRNVNKTGFHRAHLRYLRACNSAGCEPRFTENMSHISTLNADHASHALHHCILSRTVEIVCSTIFMKTNQPSKQATNQPYGDCNIPLQTL